MTDTPPIGGTTGCDHQASAVIEAAAQWLLDTPKHQRPGAAVPQLKARFGLNASQAIEAIREHNLKLGEGSMTALVDIALIIRDPAMQMRTGGLDVGVVVDYAEAFEADAAFPAVTVFTDGESFWLADGFHRIAGAEKAGRTQILADVRQGNRRDAILHAAGANAFHGMRRTGDDKRRAVLAMLQDPEWSNWSDREIGKRCSVDHKTVGKVRREVTGDVPTERTYTTKHGTVATMKVTSAEPAAAVGASMVERLLAKASDDALRTECQRRGWEVAHAH